MCLRCIKKLVKSTTGITRELFKHLFFCVSKRTKKPKISYRSNGPVWQSLAGSKDKMPSRNTRHVLYNWVATLPLVERQHWLAWMCSCQGSSQPQSPGMGGARVIASCHHFFTFFLKRSSFLSSFTRPTEMALATLLIMSTLSWLLCFRFFDPSSNCQNGHL